MKKLFLLLSLVSGSLLAQTPRLSLVPQPAQVTAGTGSFTLGPQTSLVIRQEAARPVAEMLAARLQKAGAATAGLKLEAAARNKKAATAANAIVLELQPAAAGRSPEAYELSVQPGGVLLKATDPAGLFYGVQTLLQLLPAQAGPLPAVSIRDEPRFGYRGVMIDVSRHFFSLDELKKVVDVMAQYKMNRLHWHLTDDQGWRLEIKKYPRLTEVGSKRSETLEGRMRYNEPLKFDGIPHEGFYTQEQVRELVKYAQERYVTIVPEIEMPGHAMAAIAAYPELACWDKDHAVAKVWGVMEDVFCPTETTFTFLENVLSEVIELFPSQYIHIGGDECPKRAWQQSAFCQDLMKKEGLKNEHELQSYFIRRMDKFLTAKGRRLVGWDEILEGGLSPNATVMSWRGIKGGIEAARQKHDVIMTPTTNLYIDYYQSHAVTEPLSIGGFVTLDKVYSFDPVPAELSAEEGKHILGAQCNLWTEYVKTPEHLEYMLFPRALAVAEIGWTPQASRSFADFARRIETQLPRLQAAGIKAARSIFDVQEESEVDKTTKTRTVKLASYLEGGEVRYTTDQSAPTATSPRYTGPLRFDRLTTLRTAIFRDGRQLGYELNKTYSVPE